MRSKNPFREFIDLTTRSAHQWAKEVGIHPSTVYPIYNGIRLPKRLLAIRICKATKGYLTLRDFGFED